jgi:hypothetical protein
MASEKQDVLPNGSQTEIEKSREGLPIPESLDEHYETVITTFIDGEVVPFLGAGVNRCGRPRGAKYELGKYLPDASELADYLARQFRFRGEGKTDLSRVSQYVTVMRGLGPLYRRLHSVFAADYPPTPLHQFLTTLPKVLRDKGHPPYQLIVTTNYDDVLERTFEAVGESFDVVSYVAEGEHSGKFIHWLHDGEKHLIDKANEYLDLPIDDEMRVQRTVILKIHGAVDRISVNKSNFVITEDHYIDRMGSRMGSGLLLTLIHLCIQ